MVTIKLKDIGNYYIQNCFVNPNVLTVSTEIEIYIFGVMISQMKEKTKFPKIGLCTFDRDTAEKPSITSTRSCSILLHIECLSYALNR